MRGADETRRARGRRLRDQAAELKREAQDATAGLYQRAKERETKLQDEVRNLEMACSQVRCTRPRTRPHTHAPGALLVSMCLCVREEAVIGGLLRSSRCRRRRPRATPPLPSTKSSVSLPTRWRSRCARCCWLAKAASENTALLCAAPPGRRAGSGHHGAGASPQRPRHMVRPVCGVVAFAAGH
jgi:hypothetical protein